jgi:microcystin-dependent protein
MAQTGVPSWSQTAATNATADGTVNWAEGQAPSSVNDSARAMMAGVAKYRDDIAGALETAGTSTALTLATNTVFDSLTAMSGQMVAFVPHTTSGATPTLNVDGLGAKALRQLPGVELPAGVLIEGTPYVATYYNSASEWIVHGIGGSLNGNPYNIPLGGMLDYTAATAPNSNFVLPYGQAISRTTYATYFALVSTTYGVGDGSTTFNVPDLRGRVVAGVDGMGGGGGGGRLTGGTLGAGLGAETKTIAQANLPNVTLTTTITDPGHVHNINASATGTIGGNPYLLQSTTVGGAVSGLMSSATTGITASTSLGGSGTAFNVLPPMLVLTKILRVL